jgi:membrane-associated protease RseP (regulator of RpoE activity)
MRRNIGRTFYQALRFIALRWLIYRVRTAAGGMMQRMLMASLHSRSGRFVLAVLPCLSLIGLPGGCGRRPNPPTVAASPVSSGGSGPSTAGGFPATLGGPAAAAYGTGPSSRPVVLWVGNRACYLGVELQRTHTYVRFDGGDMLPVPPGVAVAHVDPGSPASRAGLQPGDRIVGLNGASTKMDDDRRFAARLADFEPGDEISLLLSRGGKELAVKLTLGHRPMPTTTMP